MMMMKLGSAMTEEDEECCPLKGSEYRGTIDLDTRMGVSNPNGSFLTEQSFIHQEKNALVLLPQIISGKLVSKPNAIKHYKDTNEHLGKFKDTEFEEMKEYQEKLDIRQDIRYNPLGVSDDAFEEVEDDES